jgi:hypothetical protein
MRTLTFSSSGGKCRNPTLGQVWRWDLHSQKWELIVLRNSQNFTTWFQGSKHLALRCSLYCCKVHEELVLKMASYEPFGHLQHKLWSKEKTGVKLTIWLPTTKSRESTRTRCVQVKCDTQLESSRQELQVCFRIHPNPRSEQRIMSSQSGGNSNRDSFETPPWESRDKKPFGCRWRRETQIIIYGGRWWLPSSPGRGESSESVLPVACPNTKSDSECDLTNLLVDFDARPSN